MDALLVDDTSYRVHPRIVKNLGLNTHIHHLPVRPVVTTKENICTTDSLKP